MTKQSTFRKTKLVATVGPASADTNTLEKMIEAGMDVARFNFSHENHDEHARRLTLLRQASERLDKPVATMLDTKGAEIRTGSVEDGRIELVKGTSFCLLTSDELGSTDGVSISYPALVKQIVAGRTILIDDGRLELLVESTSEAALHCKVIRGGELTNHKGINIPSEPILADGLNEANQADLQFAIDNKMDYIAASFMQRASDVTKIRSFLKSHGASIPIIAKIENAEALKHLTEIVKVADGTMVARGDLGVELPPAEVPAVQKHIIRTTVKNGKPTITATQMLDSMERNQQPTRAECSDVANAILDGSSAVMLSGETARGRYPVESIRTMSDLAKGAEVSLREYGALQQIQPHPTAVVTEAIGLAAITMANHLKAAAIITLTESGFTSREISKYRPDCPIIAVTSSEDVIRRLTMNWGVTAIHYDGNVEDQAKIKAGIKWAREQRIVEKDNVVVATAGISSEKGSTNMLCIVAVD